RRVVRIAEVHFRVTDVELQLTLVERRSAIQEYGPQDLLVPFPRPLPIRDLHVDLVDHNDLRHLRDLPSPPIMKAQHRAAAPVPFPPSGICHASPPVYYHRPADT